MLCNSLSLTHIFFRSLIKKGCVEKKKKARGGKSEAVRGEMKHESGRMNFIHENDSSINIPSCRYGAVWLQKQ